MTHRQFMAWQRWLEVMARAAAGASEPAGEPLSAAEEVQLALESKRLAMELLPAGPDRTTVVQLRRGDPRTAKDLLLAGVSRAKQ